MMSAPATAAAVSAATKSSGRRIPGREVCDQRGCRASGLLAFRRRFGEPGGGEPDKVVRDLDSALDRVGDLDDGPRIRAAFLNGQVGEEPGVEQPAVGRRHDPDDGPVDVRGVGVGPMDHRHLVSIENDAGAHRVDADEIDEGLHDRGVIPPPRVLPHLLQHLIGLNRRRLVRAPLLVAASNPARPPPRSSSRWRAGAA